MKKPKKNILYLSLIILIVHNWVALLHATTYSNLDDYGLSAKSIAIGAIKSFEKSPSVVFENPAALSQLPQLSFDTLSFPLLNNAANYMAIGMGRRLFNLPFAIGVSRISSQSLKHTARNSNNETIIKELFDYNKMLVKIGTALPYNKHISVGGSLSGYYHQLYNTIGRGINADIGIFLDYQELLVSLSYKNFIKGFEVLYSNGKSESLPTETQISASYKINDFKLYSQIFLKTLNTNYLKAVGLDYCPTLFNNVISFSTGVREFQLFGSKKKAYSLGVGLHLLNINLNLAYEKSDSQLYDNNYYYSINIILDKNKV